MPVSPDWISKCIEEHKLVDKSDFEPHSSNFFSGMKVAFGNSLVLRDQETLAALFEAHGGTWTENIDSDVTHYVTSDDQDESEIKDILMVLPHWINDCICLGRFVPEDPYILSSLKVSDSNSSLEISKKFVYTHPMNLTTDHLEPIPGLFEGLRIAIEPITQDNHINLSFLVKSSGAKIVKHNYDVYICEWREGSEYSKAVTNNKRIGSPIWVYWMIYNKRFISPLAHVFHYPRPTSGCETMKDLIIGVTNIYGEARSYVQSLVETLGAKYTKTLRENNTHLIADLLKGLKYKAAGNWSIEVVNTIWLEECYALWDHQAITVPRYCYFLDNHSMMGSLLQTNLVPKVLNNLAYPVIDITSSPPPIQSSSKRELTEEPTIKLLITGISIRPTAATIKFLSRNNVQLTDDPSVCTHVVAPRILRTEKFLLALANAPVYLPASFLQTADFDKLLTDPATEQTLDRTITEILERARKAKGKLLEGYTFNFTPGLKGDFGTFNRLVRAHGANSSVFIRSLAKVSKCQKSDNGKRIMVVGEVNGYVEEFKNVFKDELDKSFCFSADWLLVSILRMELTFHEPNTSG